ncbi:MAG: hypothetical protein VYE13_01705 [Pseudomonadota bacterium]|nr:hypothetical protein [Pseudomonadota bacterium]
MVMIDRFNDEGNQIDGHLTEKMSAGVHLPHRQGPTRLSRILGFHYSAIGQSHFTSLIDILISSLRWAINVHSRGNEELRPNALDLLGRLSPLFYRDDQGRVPDIGLCFSPMNVRVNAYHRLYVDLRTFLGEAGILSSQKITNNQS